MQREFAADIMCIVSHKEVLVILKVSQECLSGHFVNLYVHTIVQLRHLGLDSGLTVCTQCS